MGWTYFDKSEKVHLVFCRKLRGMQNNFSCVASAFNYNFSQGLGGLKEAGVRSGQRERDGGRMGDGCVEVCDDSVRNDKETEGETAGFIAPRPTRGFMDKNVCVCTVYVQRPQVSQLHCRPCATPKNCFLNSLSAMTLAISSGFIKWGAIRRHFKRVLKDRSALRHLHGDKSRICDVPGSQELFCD